ncbi:hypothetical protein L208DRAFT_1350777 [Tricholoma matsutake]|nr:hypothetical protein L208DRAFT_1350777 [Tricholoma matsutake 945]
MGLSGKHGKCQCISVHIVLDNQNSVTVSGWMKCLSRSIQDKLCIKGTKLLKESTTLSEDFQITALSKQLDALSKLLGLHPSNKHGKVKHKSKPVSYKEIEGVHLICPDTFQCTTDSCDPQSLQQVTRQCDIPLVTFIKEFSTYEECPVLTGQCTHCNTVYYADHKHAPIENKQTKHARVYLNSAKYLKIGQNIWADQLFANAVVMGVYHFHASFSAYA